MARTQHHPNQLDMFGGLIASAALRRMEPHPAPPPAAPAPDPLDFAAIPGQEMAKRVLEIALTGGHFVLIRGDETTARALHDATVEAAHSCGLEEPIVGHAPLGADCPAIGRVDLVVDVEPTRGVDLDNPPPCDTSDEIAERVVGARVLLDEWEARDVEPEPDEPARRLFAQAMEAWQLGDDENRQQRILAVARTIAGLAGSAELRRVHVAEALAYAPRP